VVAVAATADVAPKPNAKNPRTTAGKVDFMEYERVMV
jgi:hypothetical protein